MNKEARIGVVIATSMSRNDKLFALSLNSVLQQSLLPDIIVIVDDNNDSNVSKDIEHRIKELQLPFIHYLQNQRTKNMSGTGAWNTGLEFLRDVIGRVFKISLPDETIFRRISMF